jgi:hypothetical protein
MQAASSDAGLKLAMTETFKLWYEVLHFIPGPQGVIVPKFPRAAPSYNLNTLSFPDPATQWETFKAGDDPAVCNQGVSIGPLDIGTRFPGDETQITVNVPNTFFATPTVTPTPPLPLPARSIGARFRIANWGTQPDVNAVTDLWQEVAFGESPAVPTASSPFKVPVEAVGTPTAASFGPNGSAAEKWEHQCMLVELSSPTFTFLNDSTYRNMHFAEASLFELSAQVSVRSLGPDPFGFARRNVFLCVQRLNMPAQVNPQDIERLQHLGNAVWKGRGRLSAEAGLAAGGSASDYVAEDDRIDLIERFTPVLKVFAFHETGETVLARGRTFNVWKQQISFHHVLNHTGPLHGWDYQIDGADMVAPDIWKVRVPNENFAIVTPRVLAKESPTDTLDHSRDSKSDCERILELVRDELTLIKRQIARCCPRKVRIEAEHFLATGGSSKGHRSGCGVERKGGWIGKINDGDWAVYGNLDFGDSEWKQGEISFISVSGGRRVELYVDSIGSLPEYLAAAGKKPPARLANAKRLVAWDLPSSGNHWTPPFREQSEKLSIVPQDKQLVIALFKKGKHSDPNDVAFVNWFEIQA